MKRTWLVLPFIALFLFPLEHALAAIVRVPKEHGTIQAAIDAANSGDTILVSPGTYAERLRLKPGVLLQSGNGRAGQSGGLELAKTTIIDGGGGLGDAPGVWMAEGSTLDGFTVTNVGRYDETVWKKHFDTKGEELGDDEGSTQAEGTVPAISIRGISCVVTRCIVHHNGDVGIGILGQDEAKTEPTITGNLVYRNMGGGIGVAEGAEPVVRGNTCRENLRAGIGCRHANPLIIDNVCAENVRAGIGCREGSRAVMVGNRCYGNRRAGIGIRMSGTAPIVEKNECYENAMAGIGCRDEASPILRGNDCHHNDMAGIGVEGKAKVMIQGNRCLENKLVAIGIAHQSTATIIENRLARAAGVPPIIAVKDGSNALIRDNEISGGGVAAVLVQGNATLINNAFQGLGEKQGKAIWVWKDSTAIIVDNAIDEYQTAVHAKQASVLISGNKIRRFRGTAILVQDSPTPAHVFGNLANSADPLAKVVEVQGSAGVEAENSLNAE